MTELEMLQEIVASLSDLLDEESEKLEQQHARFEVMTHAVRNIQKDLETLKQHIE